MKRTPAKIIKDIKEGKPKKMNYTFRLEEQLMKDFKLKCEENDVSQTEVLIELLNDFVGK